MPHNKMAEDQQIIVPIPVGGGQTQQRSDKADLIEKIKPEYAAESLRHALLGELLINGRWVKEPSLKSKALSNVGASEISQLMLSGSTVNISISRLTEQEVKKRWFSLIGDLAYMMCANWEEYEIRSVSTMRKVRAMCGTNWLGVLKQAEKGSIQELLKGTVQEQIMTQTNRTEPRTNKLKRAFGLG